MFGRTILNANVIKISASLYSGRERYQKSGGGQASDEEADEQHRLDKFADWLADGDDA